MVTQSVVENGDFVQLKKVNQHKSQASLCFAKRQEANQFCMATLTSHYQTSITMLRDIMTTHRGLVVSGLANFNHWLSQDGNPGLVIIRCINTYR